MIDTCTNYILPRDTPVLDKVQNSCYKLVVSDYDYTTHVIQNTMKKYYSEFIFTNVEVDVDAYKCEFPETFSEEDIIEANPIKANKPFEFRGVKTSFYELTSNTYEFGSNMMAKPINIKKIANYYDSLSQFKMNESKWNEDNEEKQEECLSGMDTMFSNLSEFSVKEEKKDKKAVAKEAIYFVKGKGDYHKFCPQEKIVFEGELSKFIETKFCVELEVVRKVERSVYSSLPYSIFEDKIMEKEAMEKLMNILFGKTDKEIISIKKENFSYLFNSNKEQSSKEPDSKSREGIMKRMADSMADSMWSLIETDQTKANWHISEEGIEFLWYYITLNPQEISLRDFFEFSSRELYAKTPIWWNDTQTKVFMTKYFQSNKHKWIKPGGKYSVKLLSEFRILLEHFYGFGENLTTITDYSGLYEGLFNTKAMSEESKEMWVKMFVKNNINEEKDKGTTIGSQATYTRFLQWIDAMVQWRTVKECLAKVIPIAEFTRLMKKLGHEMTRRSKGNVYLNLSFKEHAVTKEVVEDNNKEVEEPIKESPDMAAITNSETNENEEPLWNKYGHLGSAFNDISGGLTAEEFLKPMSNKNDSLKPVNKLLEEKIDEFNPSSLKFFGLS